MIIDVLKTGAKADGVSKVRVHALLDGRDVPPLTGGQFIKQLEPM